MAAFLLDEDVAVQAAWQLRVRGHDAIAVEEARLKGSGDDLILLTAALQQRILITHNGGDFRLLHDAWRRWGVPLEHAGILVMPQVFRVVAHEIAQAAHIFLDLGLLLPNHLYVLQRNGDWQAQP